MPRGPLCATVPAGLCQRRSLSCGFRGARLPISRCLARSHRRSRSAARPIGFPRRSDFSQRDVMPCAQPGTFITGRDAKGLCSIIKVSRYAIVASYGPKGIAGPDDRQSTPWKHMVSSFDLVRAPSSAQIPAHGIQACRRANRPSHMTTGTREGEQAKYGNTWFRTSILSARRRAHRFPPWAAKRAAEPTGDLT